MPVETLEFEGGGSYTGETLDGVPHGKVFSPSVRPRGQGVRGCWTRPGHSFYGIYAIFFYAEAP